jgi:hypothetical protein
MARTPSAGRVRCVQEGAKRGSRSPDALCHQKGTASPSLFSAYAVFSSRNGSTAAMSGLGLFFNALGLGAIKEPGWGHCVLACAIETGAELCVCLFRLALPHLLSVLLLSIFGVCVIDWVIDFSAERNQLFSFLPNTVYLITILQ